MDLSILSYKPPHDGALVWVKNNTLEFSIEGEKDSNPRFSGMSSTHRLLKLSEKFESIPDVLAWGGGSPPVDFGDIYKGVSPSVVSTRKLRFFGKETSSFQTTHERAHIFCSYGLSPYPQGQPLYVLVWEGDLGKFYEIDEKMDIHEFETVLAQPGDRYALAYSLADYQRRKSLPYWFFPDISDAGKMMALVSYGEIMDAARRKEWTSEVDFFMNVNLDFDYSKLLDPAEMEKVNFYKSQIQNSKIFDIGVESDDFKDFAHRLSDAIFDPFFQFAKKNLTKGYPLIISGGCGLNCDWNSRWKDCGLFSGVFVPPCTNDSGIAIGMAVDAQRHFTGNAKVDWSVYCGEEFVQDEADLSDFIALDASPDTVATELEKGKVLAWVEGKYEIGPRALCHRSLIAAPFTKEMHQRLNKIKNREGFRPIAPVCLEEDVSEYFDWKGPSPYMLYFQWVKTDRLKAITHVNNSARVQTVNNQENPRMCDLLRAFKKRTGFSVLCNTSLNFKGKGFINRMSDLSRYARETELDGFVVGDKLYLKSKFEYRRASFHEEIQNSRPYLDLNVTVNTWTWADPKGSSIFLKVSDGTLTVDFDSTKGNCVFGFASNVGPFVVPEVIDLQGYHFFQFKAHAPKDVNFHIQMLESGAGPSSNTAFWGVNGADGECYFFPTLIGTGGWETYRIDLSTLQRQTTWGNQNGNGILDLQALSSLEIHVHEQALGTLHFKDLEFLASVAENG